MAKSVKSYSVRVLLYVGKYHTRCDEVIKPASSLTEAIDLFRYYVNATLEFNLNVRCINLLCNRKTFKLFQNHEN